VEAASEADWAWVLRREPGQSWQASQHWIVKGLAVAAWWFPLLLLTQNSIQRVEVQELVSVEAQRMPGP
jgi:hypothetical protein